MVLTTSDLHGHFARDRTKPNLTAAILTLSGRDTHRHFVVSYLHGYRQRENGGIAPRLLNCLFDRRVLRHMRVAGRNGRAARAYLSSRDSPNNRPQGSWSLVLGHVTARQATCQQPDKTSNPGL